MSTDRDVTEEVMEVLADGRNRFADASEKLRDSARPDLAATFDEFARQRASFHAELERLAATYGHDVDESGSAEATNHRPSTAVDGSVGGSDVAGVVDAAVRSEDETVSTYEDALSDDICPQLRRTLQRQFAAVQATHGWLVAMQEAAENSGEGQAGAGSGQASVVAIDPPPTR